MDFGRNRQSNIAMDGPVSDRGRRTACRRRGRRTEHRRARTSPCPAAQGSGADAAPAAQGLHVAGEFLLQRDFGLQTQNLFHAGPPFSSAGVTAPINELRYCFHARESTKRASPFSGVWLTT